MGYRVIDHTADLGIEVVAGDLDELFADAALAFTDCVTVLGAVGDQEVRSFRLESDSVESLLVDWLGELLFVFETSGLLVSTVDAGVSQTAEGWRIAASARGETWDDARHQLKVPIKAVTYHGLEVVRREGRWCARIVFGI